MDGKHIRIVPPPHSGSKYYNYKNFHSIVLMALVNSNYEFIYVDIGKNGRLSDGEVLEYTEFYRNLKLKKLNFPNNSETVNNLNFVVVGDEAFSLDDNFLKPYAQRELDSEKRISITDCLELLMWMKMRLVLLLQDFVFYIHLSI